MRFMSIARLMRTDSSVSPRWRSRIASLAKCARGTLTPEISIAQHLPDITKAKPPRSSPDSRILARASR